MNNLIEAEYQIAENIEDKSTDELRAEINSLYSQMEAIGNIGLMMMAQAGQRLNVIKARLGHGNWETWAGENLNFSLRKANNMMAFAKKVEDENSIFFKSANFADIGISKVWALLSAPEEVAEEVIKAPDVSEITVKELQERVKQLEAEKAAVDAAGSKIQTDYDSAMAKVATLEKEIEILKETPGNEEELEKLRTELSKAQNSLSAEKEKSKKIRDSAEAEKTKAVEEAIKKAREEVKKEAAAESAKLLSDYEESQRVIAKLQQSLQNNSQADIAIFKVKSNQLQQDFNSCLDSIDKVSADEPVQAEKMKVALKTVMTQLAERI
ncbi:MAG: DUF3102 domain-containing protein [Firmicutes bacterium]|nr:DUF3102 domain-containing protein [Bacillota bacterium]MBQ6901142.1 DUF3102 domain-containing protein [Bacillota bacterium]